MRRFFLFFDARRVKLTKKIYCASKLTIRATGLIMNQLKNYLDKVGLNKTGKMDFRIRFAQICVSFSI